MKIYKRSFHLNCRSAEITCCERILSCVNQYETITVWYVSGETDKKQSLLFRMTGEDVPTGTFLGTMLFEQGTFVLHAFIQ